MNFTVAVLCPHCNLRAEVEFTHAGHDPAIEVITRCQHCRKYFAACGVIKLTVLTVAPLNWKPATLWQPTDLWQPTEAAP